MALFLDLNKLICFYLIKLLVDLFLFEKVITEQKIKLD